EEVRLAFADDLGHLALDNDCRRFVEADAEILGIRLHEFRHLRMALALAEMLVDGDALEKAETAFVAFVANIDVVEDAAAAQVLAGEGGAGARPADDATTLQDVEHERQGLGVFVAIDEAPLPPAVEPQARGFTQRVEKLLAFDLLQRLAVEDRRLLGT